MAVPAIASKNLPWDRNRDVTERYAPVILSALKAAGVAESVAVHRVLAVLIDTFGWNGIDDLTWSDLIAMTPEANAIAKLHVRTWEGRVASYGLGAYGAFPSMTGAAIYAVADDTIGNLLARESA